MTSISTSTYGGTTNSTNDCGIDFAEAELPLILLPTFILNTVAFAVFLKMKSSTESLDRTIVFSLVVNDLLTTSLYIITIVMGWISCKRILQNNFVCSLMGWLTTTMVMWSAGVITVMTSCRYLALVKPIYYRSKVTSGSVKIGLLGTLIWAALHLIFPFFNLASPYRMYEQNHICAYEFTPGVGGIFHKTVLGMIGAEGLIVIVLVTFFNVSVIHQLRKKNRVSSEPQYQTHLQSRERRTAFVNVSILISLFFCICYGPFLVRLLYDVTVDAKSQSDVRHSVSLSLLFLSPLVNPIFYGIFNKRFRECLIEMVRGCCRGCRCRGDKSQEAHHIVVKTVAQTAV